MTFPPPPSGSAHPPSQPPSQPPSPPSSQPPSQPPPQAQSTVQSRRVTRRGVLLGASGVVVAAGAGAGIGYLRPLRSDRHTPIPPDLADALDAEHALIGQIDASVAQDASLHALLAPIRADHVAHLEAITAAIRTDTGQQAPSPAPSGSRAGTRSALRNAEQVASTRAATRAAHLTGTSAVVLASIAACEATHAEVLA